MRALLRIVTIATVSAWLGITNLASSRSVVVRIIDRGPRNRIPDLSLCAAGSLGITYRGVAQVL
ncbi:RlpA-like double-psi beta-barrel domain-containing protein [Bradyrhizobium sp. sBnM-33]